jgi:hypothetical protein
VKLYVSATSNDERKAFLIAKALGELGHTVVSTWHKPDAPGVDSDDAKQAAAVRNVIEISEADALVLVTSKEDEKIGGGKFAEAGAAFFAGKTVYLLNGSAVKLPRRENLMMHHPLVQPILSLTEIPAPADKGGKHTSGCW